MDRLEGSPLPPGCPPSSEVTCEAARPTHWLGIFLLSPRLHVVGPPDPSRSPPRQRLGEVRPPCPSVRLRPGGIQHRRDLGEPYEVVRLLSHVQDIDTTILPIGGGRGIGALRQRAGRALDRLPESIPIRVRPLGGIVARAASLRQGDTEGFSERLRCLRGLAASLSGYLGPNPVASTRSVRVR